jgi:hypothetical protein
MDPNYSVILGDTANPCDSSNGVSHTAYIAVFSTLGGLALVAVAAYFIAPKVKLYYQLHLHHGTDIDMGELANSSPKPEFNSDSVLIERATDMEVHTAAGRFVVKM